MEREKSEGGMDWRFYFQYFRLGRCDRQPHGMLGGGERRNVYTKRGGKEEVEDTGDKGVKCII